MPESRDLPILRELRDELHAGYVAAERGEGPARRSARRRRRAPGRRWLVSAGGLTAAAGIAAWLALTSGIDEGRVASPPATAAELLRRTAEAAAAQPSALPAPGAFSYVHSLATNLSQHEGPGPAYARLVTVDRRIWTSLERPAASWCAPRAPPPRARRRSGRCTATTWATRP